MAHPLDIAGNMPDIEEIFVSCKECIYWSKVPADCRVDRRWVNLGYCTVNDEFGGEPWVKDTDGCWV